MIKKLKLKYRIITILTIITSILTGLHFIIISLLIGLTYYLSLGKIVYARKFNYFDKYLKEIGKEEVKTYLIKSKHPNAFNIGKNIFFSTEFIRRFGKDKDIMYATLGHELGHYSEKHQIIIVITSLIYIAIATFYREIETNLYIIATATYLILLIALIWILEIKADLYSIKLSKENAKGLINVLSQLKRFSITHPPAWIRIKIIRRYSNEEK